MSEPDCADKTVCYGKFPDLRGKPETFCPHRNNCELGAPCLSRSREPSDDEHYQNQNISVPHMIYDPNEDGGEDDEISKTFYEYDGVRIEQGAGDLELDGLVIPAAQRPLFCDIISKLAEFHRKSPKTLEFLFASTLKNQSQSSFAREKKVTRACVNKWLLTELKIAQKRNDAQERRDRELAQAKKRLKLAEEQAASRAEAFTRMSGAEFAVYKICAEDGCLSITSIAEQTGYRIATISDAVKNLRVKYGITVKLQRYSRKKIRKKC